MTSRAILIRSVFVHRVRDSDANIRTDCLKELGVWIEAYPSQFGDDQYLGYFIRGCNDPVSLVCRPIPTASARGTWTVRADAAERGIR